MYHESDNDLSSDEDNEEVETVTDQDPLDSEANDTDVDGGHGASKDLTIQDNSNNNTTPR